LSFGVKDFRRRIKIKHGAEADDKAEQDCRARERLGAEAECAGVGTHQCRGNDDGDRAQRAFDACPFWLQYAGRRPHDEYEQTRVAGSLR